MARDSEAFAALERDLRDIFGERLRSLIAYGMHAAGASPAQEMGHGHHAAETPLVHTMAIVKDLTAEDLRACSERIAKWRDSGLATPLVLAAYEFERSLDAFPLEFGAIIADHEMVAGEDPFDAWSVDAADLRRACEVQARSHLLHLRQGYLETHGNADALAVLIVGSAAPFAALLASIARLQGLVTHDAGAIGRHLERALNVPGGTVTGVSGLAGVAEIPAADAIRIFPTYLDAVERLVKFVDGWSAA